MTIKELKEELTLNSFKYENRDVMIEVNGRAYNIGYLYLLVNDEDDFENPQAWTLVIGARAERGIELV